MHEERLPISPCLSRLSARIDARISGKRSGGVSGGEVEVLWRKSGGGWSGVERHGAAWSDVE